MAEFGVKNARTVPYVRLDEEESVHADFFTQKKLPVDHPEHVYQQKLRVESPVDHHFHKSPFGNRRGSQHPVKKVHFDPKLFPYGQLMRVTRPHYLRRDSGDSRLVLDNQGSVIY